MRSRLLFALLLLAASLGVPGVASAAAEATLQMAPDGTLLVIGRGWRPSQELAVNLGGDRFTAYTDSGGAFEVATGLTFYSGSIGVRRLERADVAFLALDSATESDAPSDLAVLFAQSLASGVTLFGVSAGVLLIGYVATRPWRRKRRH